MPDLIHMKNVSLIRGGRRVLDRIDLTIAEKENVAILGPNGAGKSSLIKLLSRELYPYTGEPHRFSVMGLERWNVFSLRSHLGIVTNDVHQACTKEVTGLEVVLSGFFGTYGVLYKQELTDQMLEKAHAVLEFLEVPHLADRTADTVSSGEARRLLIARALVNEPSGLFLDEPTNSLDVVAAARFLDSVRKISQNGMSVVLVTHHIHEIVPEISRVIMLSHGRVLIDAPKEEALTEQNLSLLFGGKVHLSEEYGIYRAYAY